MHKKKKFKKSLQGLCAYLKFLGVHFSYFFIGKSKTRAKTKAIPGRSWALFHLFADSTRGLREGSRGACAPGFSRLQVERAAVGKSPLRIGWIKMRQVIRTRYFICRAQTLLQQDFASLSLAWVVGLGCVLFIRH